MDAGERAVSKGLWRADFAELAALQFGQHMVGAGRHFMAGHQRAAEHFILALVLGMEVVEEGFHGGVPVGKAA